MRHKKQIVGHCNYRQAYVFLGRLMGGGRAECYLTSEIRSPNNFLTIL